MPNLRALEAFLQRRTRARDPRYRQISEMSMTAADEILSPARQLYAEYVELPPYTWQTVARCGIVAVAEETVWPRWEGVRRVGLSRIARALIEQSISSDLRELYDRAWVHAYFRWKGESSKMTLASLNLGSWVYEQCFARKAGNSGTRMSIDIGHTIALIGNGIAVEILELGKSERHERNQKEEKASTSIDLYTSKTE